MLRWIKPLLREEMNETLEYHRRRTRAADGPVISYIGVVRPRPYRDALDRREKEKQ